MKTKKLLSIFAAFGLFIFHASATVRYVDLNCLTPTSPYTSWSTAATNIQPAVQIASSGDLVLVTNGIYEFGGSLSSGSNRVNVSSAITLQSVNGPLVTSIKGHQVPGTTNGVGAARCVFLANNATLSGFTITNGATAINGSGGGVLCQSSSSLVTNCIICGNSCDLNGGGASSGKLINCIISGNTSSLGGGAYDSTLINCTISNNFASSAGGGVFEMSPPTSTSLINCTLSGNTSLAGGGICNGTLVNCTLANNSATSTSAGNGGGGVNSGVLTNCVITGNYSGSLGGGSRSSKLVNCTVSANTAVTDGGGVSGGSINNCIVYDNFLVNSNPGFTNYSGSPFPITMTNCCTTPLPASGTNNITAPPLFVNPSGGDFHLQSNSPCSNAGNNSFITITNDLDGNPRIVGPRVDIGAYENQYLATGTFYVSISNPQPSFPFQTWDTAATNIQDAIDVASSGGQILVSNGVYRTGGRVVYGSLTNRVVVNRSLTIQSVNGAAVTSIEGYQMPGTTNGNNAIRCIYLTNGVVLDGFTLTNGATRSTGLVSEQSGGGIWCESTNAFIRNCVMCNNAAHNSGGGIYSGTLTNCTMMDNQLGSGGGGGGGASSSTLNYCTLARNKTGSTAGASGGGAISSMLNNCLVSNNVSVYPGGGVASSTLNYCKLIGNSTAFYEGGGAASSTLNNCLVISNSTPLNGGGASSSTLSNCTIAGNSAGQRGGGTYLGTVYNSVVYYNTATIQGSNYNNYYNSGFGNNCCTLPAPNGGVITNAPLFVNVSGGDFHLQSTSPCINAGNNVYASGTTDLDGNPRVVGYAVDAGAYEKSPASILPNDWLQQYGFPNDGSFDFVDSDGTGMNNWQKWIAGLNPTNPASVLVMSSPAGVSNGVTVTWQSVNTRTYYLQRASDLAQPFSSIQSNLVGQAGTTSFTDTSATNSGSYFYRIGVQ